MSPPEVVLATGDAYVKEYRRTFDELVIVVLLWDESIREIRARDLGELHDTGTYECDAVVRRPELDGDGRTGYAVIDTEANPTLIFSARELDLGVSAPPPGP